VFETPGSGVAESPVFGAKRTAEPSAPFHPTSVELVTTEQQLREKRKIAGYSTVPGSTLWPEYLELQEALHSYPNEAPERMIREEVYGDTGEAAERVG
jgi:hypothetical protein